MQLALARTQALSAAASGNRRAGRKGLVVRAQIRDKAPGALQKAAAAGLAAVFLSNVAPALAAEQGALLDEILGSGKTVKVLKSSQKVEPPSYSEVKKLVAVPKPAPAKKDGKKRAEPKKPAPKKDSSKPKPSSSSSSFKLSGGVGKGVQGEVPQGLTLTPKPVPGAKSAPAPKAAPAKPAARPAAKPTPSKPAPAPKPAAPAKPSKKSSENDRANQAASAAAAAAAAAAAFSASQAVPTAPTPAPATPPTKPAFFFNKEPVPAASAAPALTDSSTEASPGLSLADPAAQAGAVAVVELLAVAAATSTVGSILKGSSSASNAPGKAVNKTVKKTVRA